MLRFSPVHLNNILWRIMKIFLADYSEFLVSSDFSFKPFQRISFGSVSFLIDELWALILTQVYVAYGGLDHICAFWNHKFFYVLGVIFVGWTLLKSFTAVPSDLRKVFIPLSWILDVNKFTCNLFLNFFRFRPVSFCDLHAVRQVLLKCCLDYIDQTAMRPKFV